MSAKLWIYQRNVPVSGTSVGRMTLLICSMLCRSGERPPCIVKIFSSMIAAIGKQLKQSVKVFHSLMLYLRLPRESGVDMSHFSTHIRRKSHRFGLYSRIRGYHEG